ncbi:hypothetical protein E1294_29960 [Nonomuraea diastatica]|uniref:Transposase n=1 Tax=Nonomuraea diastatica TaxID=1848329 RepID=A0A4R4WHE2_9ACTN|nr:hypothetical protein [Nonomuraea diastatica]TDD16807.1 hypothetical protein E1294_29960 [Nonomuraea diastatica]
MLQDVLADTEWAALLKPADRRGLTPLFWQHVQPYGQVRLDVGDVVVDAGPAGPGGFGPRGHLAQIALVVLGPRQGHVAGDVILQPGVVEIVHLVTPPSNIERDVHARAGLDDSLGRVTVWQDLTLATHLA